VTARQALCIVLAAAAAGAAAGCRGEARDAAPRVVILGFDGMDYALTRELMQAGRLPHFQRLATTGAFTALETSVPPQSPVAWSDFVTGTDAGGHGIFDFVHRDPKTMLPYLSTTRTEPGRSLRLGAWRLQLSGGKVELLRYGTPFWERLEARGIPTTIVRMPANFPPSGTATRELAGMGTPDLLGTYGTFTFYTSDPQAAAETKVSGGRIVAVRPVNGAFDDVIVGPDNPLRAAPEPLSCAFHFWADPERGAGKIAVGTEERVLRQGEWSDWVPLRFALAPTRTLPGMCRFYLKQVHPHIELYAAPVNLDPVDPALPISTPADWAAELARSTGRYYTQGIPEDTKAYSAGVFDTREFLQQARLVADEHLRQYRAVLDRFTGGLLFYYFGSVDQVSHMLWRPMDPKHPAYDAKTDAPFANVVPAYYAHADSILGETLARVDAQTLVVAMSDHGFTSWRRAFNLNGWLRDQGYLVVRDPDRADDGPLTNIDWERTRAYGLGLNGLYVNLQGRERWGIVPVAERDALMQVITAKLLATLDPATGEAAVTRVYPREATYRGRGHLEIGPDLVVGYARGTRCSEDSGIGAVRGPVFSDNTGAWSGDHCMDHTAVPGILVVNRPLRRPVRALSDLGAAVLAEYGVEVQETTP
jgi:predicted AlkP superfamily phosphohydrolase/phosphomutase